MHSIEAKDIPTWVYHKTNPAKVVSEKEAQKLYKNGWFDCPTKAKNSEPKKKKEKKDEGSLEDESTGGNESENKGDEQK